MNGIPAFLMSPAAFEETARWVFSYFQDEPLYLLILPYCVFQPVFRAWATSANFYEKNKSLCKWIMAGYNLIMTVFSAICAGTMIYCLMNLINGVYAVGHFSDRGVGEVYAKVTYAFYFSKYIEFIDTYFLILMDRPVSWLQYLHHIGAPLIMGFLYHWQAEGAWCFVALNGVIHTFMYYYYACCILKWKFPFPKNLITVLQLLQFVTGIGAYSAYYWVPAYWAREEKRLGLILTDGYVLMNFVMFTNFYIRTYVLPPKAKKKAA